MQIQQGINFGRPLLRYKFFKCEYKNSQVTQGLQRDLCNWESLNFKLHELSIKFLCDYNHTLWGRTEVKNTKNVGHVLTYWVRSRTENKFWVSWLFISYTYIFIYSKLSFIYMISFSTSIKGTMCTLIGFPLKWKGNSLK